MRSMRDMSGPLASLALVLACLALALRIATPPGFMISTPDGARSSPIVVCTGQGPLTLHLNDYGRRTPPTHDGDDRAHGPCAFAAIGPALAVQPPMLAAKIVYRYVPPAIIGSLAARCGVGLTAPPPPQTGPPSFA